ncbi:MAG TPA: hypothetical protein ENG70_02290 [Candidatus Cloacimonetes bacterium]|nr:hypothetical protein [Candidatus Cloacimonadota bacterium]HEX37675.1 hypothetical protein [Candidatus Cloacimonadota bacterium]
MKVYTTIGTLKKVWNVMKELSLSELITNNKAEIDLNVSELCDNLLVKGKLNEVCQIVTKTDEDFEEKELDEVIGVLTDFFTNIGNAFKKLRGIATIQKTQPQKKSDK